MNESLIALFAATFGGAGLKFIEYLLSRGKAKQDLAQSIREELRSEVQSLRDELRQVQEEVDAWRQKYYDLLDRFYIERKEVVTPEPLPNRPKKE